jgi:hypothetical protein
MTLFNIMDFRTVIELTSGGETFHCVGNRVTSKGFTSIMPWLAVSENNLPAFRKGDTVSIHKVDIYEVRPMWFAHIHEHKFYPGFNMLMNHGTLSREAPHLLII